MNWEKLTSSDFAKAVKETGVCIIVFGVVEKHGEHLPLGTDYLNGQKLATAAAEIEPAVVFPPFYFGQIYEAKCFPGTITIKPRLLIDLIENVLDEIGRNGFKKIILLNAHGGNDFLLKFIAQCQLAEEKPYQVYMYQQDPEVRKHFNEIFESELHGHACECETSISLYNHQELVKMEEVPAETELPKRHLAHLPNHFSGLSWYSNYPHHYVGNANYASYEKGERYAKLQIDALAKFIAKVKKDEVLPMLSKEFFSKVQH
ncbi:MAG TPA: creatininase family protein [Acholeplasmataceae bacterium]|nr:creatininase family protein [Acholeplasmataceae bacterium]